MGKRDGITGKNYLQTARSNLRAVVILSAASARGIYFVVCSGKKTDSSLRSE
jgi:hypothetical protein